MASKVQSSLRQSVILLTLKFDEAKRLLLDYKLDRLICLAALNPQSDMNGVTGLSTYNLYHKGSIIYIEVSLNLSIAINSKISIRQSVILLTLIMSLRDCCLTALV